MSQAEFDALVVKAITSSPKVLEAIADAVVESLTAEPKGAD